MEDIKAMSEIYHVSIAWKVIDFATHTQWTLSVSHVWQVSEKVYILRTSTFRML